MNIALKPTDVASLSSYETTTAPANNIRPDFEFAGFLQQQLRWRKIRLNKYQDNILTAVAERQNKKGQTLRDLAILWYAVSLGFIIVGFAMGYDSFFHDGMEQVLSWSGAVLLVSIQVFILIARRIYREKAWVGANNSTSKTGIEEIEKNLRMFWKYAASSNGSYNFTTHYFLSANGFTWEALEFATENNIACYEMKNGQFEPVHSSKFFWQR